MKKFLSSKVKAIVLCGIILMPTYQVAHAQCEVGSVLFKDTLFGAAIGLGVGALVLVANQTSDHIAPNLATATLIGAGVGAVVGVVELSISDCSSRRNASLNGFRASPLLTFMPQSHIEGPSISETLNATSSLTDKLSIEKLNKMAMGVSMSYTFSN